MKIPYDIYKTMITRGLTPVEYIENTGNDAYIDTGIKPTEIHSLYVEYKASEITYDRPMYIAGALRTVSADTFAIVFKDARHEDSYARFGSESYEYAECDTNKHSVMLDDTKLYYDGELVNTFSGQKGTCRYNIFLFHVNYYGSALSDRCLVGRIYRARLCDNAGNSVKDYYPCINASGDVGMFDAVSKAFVGSANSDTFTAGNVVRDVYDELPIIANGSSFHNLALRKYTVDSVVMSLGDKITGDIVWKDTSLVFSMQEYVVYAGTKYVLVNPPTVVREGMVADNSELKGAAKYSLTFYHPMYMLGNFPFTDIAVTDDEQKYLSESKTFSWIGTLFDFIAKLNANLQGTEWVVRANIPHYEQDGETVTSQWQKASTTSEVMSFDKNYISEALKKAYDEWEIPFTITDATNIAGKKYVIEFGLPSQEIYGDDGVTPYVFRFGQGVGLKNNSKTPRNNKIITRIVGCGAERNVPYGYPQIPWYGDQTWNYTINNASGMQPITVGGVTIQAMSYPIYDGVVGGQPTKLIKHPFTRKTLMPSIYGQTLFNKVSPYLSDGTANPNYNPNTTLVDYYDAIDELGGIQYPNNINPLAPSVEHHQFEKVYPKLGDKTLVNVLPYDDKTYISWNTFYSEINSYIANSNNDNEKSFLNSCREAVYHCDYGLSFDIESRGGSYTGKSVGQSYKYGGGWWVDVSYTSDNVNFKRNVYLGSYNPSKVVEWDDTYDSEKDEYKQSYFKMRLPLLDFDLYACAIYNEEMKINMRSGACIGCSFPIQIDWDDYKANFYTPDGTFAPDGEQRNTIKYPKSNVSQIAVVCKKEVETFGTLMPNIYQQPATGDLFTILGINLPNSYISSAQTELDGDMKEYMLENNVHYFDYPLKFDELFLKKRQAILDQIKNNCIVRFESDSTEIALYIKQITKKYGESPLPKYDITLADDIEIVLNSIGQVTDDVSRMRVQMSDIQKYYSESIIREIKNKLSRIEDDICSGRITFQQGLSSIGEIILYGGIRSDIFVSGLYTGRGWKVDELGNAEFESLRVRSFLEIVELLVNRMQAQEGDTMFTDNDVIDKVTPYDLTAVSALDSDNPSLYGWYELVDNEYVLSGDRRVVSGKTYYKASSLILSLKEKYNGYYTSQKLGNILRGVINIQAAVDSGLVKDQDTRDMVFYTSWMKVIQTATESTGSGNPTLTTNQIRVELYYDDEVPGGRNFAPCELMTIARWGNILDPQEQGISDAEKRRRLALCSSFYISTTDGRITKLNNVRAPILTDDNYGTTLGILPEFVQQYTSIAPRIADGQDYLYAQGVVVQDFIKIDRNGNVVSEGNTEKEKTIYKWADTKPATPTGTNIPPAGWSESPNVTFPDIELDGPEPEGQYTKVVQRIDFYATEGNATLTLNAAVSSEADYDFLLIGKLDKDDLYNLPAVDIWNDVDNTGDYYVLALSGENSRSYTFSGISAGSHHVYVAFVSDRNTIHGANNGIISYVSSTNVTPAKHLWVSKGDLVNGALSGSWSEPIQENGVDGQDGQDGQDGARGKVGRFFYYAGDFSLQDQTNYVINDAQAPYFSHVEDGQTLYHVFNPETNPSGGTMTTSQMWAASSNNWNNAPWEVMTNDFKYIITEALFANFALLGSFVVNLDFFLSQYGTLISNSGGTITRTTIDATNYHTLVDGALPYTYFDASDPEGETDPASGGHKFVPSLYQNAKTGRIVGDNCKFINMVAKGGTFDGITATNADISGILRSPVVYSPFYEVGGGDVVDLNASLVATRFTEAGIAGIATIYLPAARDCNGLELNFFSPRFTRSVMTTIKIKASGSDFLLIPDGSGYYSDCPNGAVVDINIFVTIVSIGNNWVLLNGTVTPL